MRGQDYYKKKWKEEGAKEERERILLLLEDFNSIDFEDNFVKKHNHVFVGFCNFLKEGGQYKKYVSLEAIQEDLDSGMWKHLFVPYLLEESRSSERGSLVNKDDRASKAYKSDKSSLSEGAIEPTTPAKGLKEIKFRTCECGKLKSAFKVCECKGLKETEHDGT